MREEFGLEDALIQQGHFAGTLAALSRHHNLLEASFDGPGDMPEWIRKPLLGREGANVRMLAQGGDWETTGSSGEEGFRPRCWSIDSG